MVAICFDMETTGLDPRCHEIISIGAYTLRNTFLIYINPTSEDLGRTDIHGFSRDKSGQLCLNGKPVKTFSLEVALRRLKNFIYREWRNRRYRPYLLAHNGRSFDFRFLLEALNQTGIRFPKYIRIGDSLEMAKTFYGQRNMKGLGRADLIRKLLGINVPAIHTAEKDAQDVNEIVAEMARRSNLRFFLFLRMFDQAEGKTLMEFESIVARKRIEKDRKTKRQ